MLHPPCSGAEKLSALAFSLCWIRPSKRQKNGPLIKGHPPKLRRRKEEKKRGGEKRRRKEEEKSTSLFITNAALSASMIVAHCRQQ
jgi:hypothetical protein